jgi:hypothetical protein
MNLDLIGYGNPNQNHLKWINKESYLDSLFAELTQFTFPKNSSEATKEELNQLIVKIKETQVDEEKQKVYQTFDVYPEEYYVKFLSQYNIPREKVEPILDSIHEDIKPLIIKLKYFFQRPRPFQLAYYYKLKLIPFMTLSADSPSFPSGHAIESKVISEVLGNMYPELYVPLEKIAEEVSESRLGLGVHYQSDIDVGVYVAERICETKEFMIKYQL